MRAAVSSSLLHLDETEEQLIFFGRPTTHILVSTARHGALATEGGGCRLSRGTHTREME